MLVEVYCIYFIINLFGASCKYPVKPRWYWGLSVAVRKLPVSGELVGRAVGDVRSLLSADPGSGLLDKVWHGAQFRADRPPCGRTSWQGGCSGGLASPERAVSGCSRLLGQSLTLPSAPSLFSLQRASDSVACRNG